MIDILLLIGSMALMVIVFYIVFVALLLFMVTFPKMIEDLHEITDRERGGK
jgi:hypothetical protein